MTGRGSHASTEQVGRWGGVSTQMGSLGGRGVFSSALFPPKKEFGPL